MSILEAIILGVVQGITEFLPVSSSGHLVLLQEIFGIENNVILFDCILHLGTLFAVLTIYRKQILNLLKNPFGEFAKKLYLSTFFTLIIVFILKDFFENAFSGTTLIFGFLTTAIFLLIAEKISQKNKKPIKINYLSASLIGIFQGFAVTPGLSRSGTTISCAIAQGINKEDATEFSFLLSIPIIVASTLFEFIKVSKIENLSLPLMCFIVGFLCSFLSGYLAIKIMIKTIKKAKYHYFSIYLVVLSLFLILNKFFLFLF